MSDFDKRNEWENNLPGKESDSNQWSHISSNSNDEEIIRDLSKNSEEEFSYTEVGTNDRLATLEGNRKEGDSYTNIGRDSSQIETKANSENTKVRSRKASKAKSFAALLAAGIVGSALTFVTIPHTDLYNDSYEKLEKQVADLSNKVNANNSNAITASATAATSKSDGSSVSIADVVETSSKAIVGIVNMQQQSSPFSQDSSDVESGSGSGIIFKKDDKYAYIVTNNHVIEDANTLQISLYSGDQTDGTLIGADALTDLAVVRIDAKYATDTINFGDSSTLRPGDEVWAIGNPLGVELSRTVTQGIVSAVNRSITVSTSAGDWDFNVIQTDAAINPGNSGGALINSSGQVIGINSLKISDDGVEGLGFAIPSNDLIPIVNEIIENGKVERPYLGVGLASLEEVPRMYLQDLPNDVTQGVMITNVDSNSAAAKAGLKVQDVITAINGNKVTSSTDLRKYLYSEVEIGEKVELNIYRDGKSQKVELTLTSNSSSTN